MASTPDGLSVSEIQPSPSLSQLSTTQSSSSPANQGFNGQPTTPQTNAPINSSSEPLQKPILCCDKLKIFGKPPFNPFGHPQRKLHYLCSHWSGKMPEPDEHEHDSNVGLDPSAFWGVISVLEIDSAIKKKSLRWYAPYCNSTFLGGRDGLGGPDGRYMEITHKKAMKMLMGGYLVQSNEVLRYAGCTNHPDKKFVGYWHAIPVEAVQN